MFSIIQCNIGSENRPRSALVHRTQWADVNGGYQTSMLSFDSPLFINNKRIAKKPNIGGMIQSNIQGKSQAVLTSIAYSYPLELNKDSELRLGIQLNYQLFTYGTQAIFSDQFQPTQFGVRVAATSNDPLNTQERFVSNKMNFTTGFEFSKKQSWKAGIAFHQFINLRQSYVLSNIQISPSESTQLILMGHYYAGNLQADFNFLHNLENKILCGIGYRGLPFLNKGNLLRNNDLILLIGAKPKKDLSIMGSFDLNLSNTRQSTRNSFEVSIKYSLKDKYCPAYGN